MDSGSNAQDLQNFYDMFNMYVVQDEEVLSDANPQSPRQDFSGPLPDTSNFPSSAMDVMNQMFSSWWYISSLAAPLTDNPNFIG